MPKFQRQEQSFCTELLSKFFTLSIFVLGSCAPNVTKYSARSPDLFEKPSNKLSGYSRGTDPESSQPDVYVKEKKTVISDKERPNTTGSLFQKDHEGNFLFVPASPAKVGRSIAIQVAPNRQSKPEDPKADQKQDTTNQGTPNNDEEELLKAIPDLTPKNKGPISLLKEFKVNVIHKYPNGDVLTRMERTSKTDEDAHQLVVEAKIPFERLASGDPITTNDLLDVKFNEYNTDETIKRHSSGWEDEYSLRLSGFTEAKSKIAADIPDQKTKLDEAKQRLQDRIKSLSSERRQLAKMREEFAQKRLESDNKLKAVNEKLDESKELIEEQQSTIEEQKQTLEEIETKKGEKEGKKDNNNE